MSDILNIIRNEIYPYFDKEIVSLIKSKEHTKELLNEICIKFNGKFGVKYQYAARIYGDCIRVSVHYVPLSIMFFMAATKDGGIQYKFKDPCYWGSEGKK